MNDINLLLSKNEGCGAKIKLVKYGLVVINIKDAEINLQSIYKICLSINDIRTRYQRVLPNVVIEFSGEYFAFADKLTWTLPECICYESITKHDQTIMIVFSGKYKRRILNEKCIEESPLRNLGYGNCNVNYFLSEFRSFYRPDRFGRLIKESQNRNEELVSATASDVRTFFNLYDIDENFSTELTAVISELVGNAIEHALADCLVDIDISDNYSNVNNQDCIGLNVAIVNFSSVGIGDALKKKITGEVQLPIRYQNVQNAYENHKQEFSLDYTENDFYMIAAFQQGISGRDNIWKTGGMGLTKLITKLEMKADLHHCYMLAGERCLRFSPECVAYNKDGWIGFNKENDFLSKPPSSSILMKAPIYMPGTAYNLNFIVLRETRQ